MFNWSPCTLKMFLGPQLKCYTDQLGLKYTWCDKHLKTCYTKLDSSKHLEIFIYFINLFFCLFSICHCVYSNLPLCLFVSLSLLISLFCLVPMSFLLSSLSLLRARIAFTLQILGRSSLFFRPGPI